MAYRSPVTINLRAKNAAITTRPATLLKIPEGLVDEPVAGPMSARELNNVATALKKALVERSLGAERARRVGVGV